MHVPVVLWTSEKYKEYYPQKYEAVLKNKDLPLSLVDMFYTFLDMGNIGIKDKKSSISIANPNFEVRERWHTKGDRPLLWKSERKEK